MAHLVAHIGVMKTGTTYIQGLLHENRDVLAAHGWFTPDFAGANHATYVFGFADRITATVAGRGINSPSQQREHIEAVRASTLAQIESNPVPSNEQKWLISSEQFSMLLQSAESVKSAADFLRELFDSVRIVVALRRQDHAATSVYSQNLKDGFTHEWSEQFCRRVCGRLDYYPLIDRWVRAVGKENVTAIPYFENYRSQPHTFLTQFAVATGCPIDSHDLVPPPRANESLSAEAMEFLRLVNPYLPRFPKDFPGRSPVRNPLITQLAGLCEPGRFEAEVDLMEKVRKDSHDSNQQAIDLLGGGSEWEHWLSQEVSGVQDPDRPSLSTTRIMELVVATSHPNGPIDWGQPDGIPAHVREKVVARRLQKQSALPPVASPPPSMSRRIARKARSLLGRPGPAAKNSKPATGPLSRSATAGPEPR